MTRRRVLTALLWAYGVFTVTALVCTVATDVMWEACGYRYGAEPSALYSAMEAVTHVYVQAAVGLVMGPVLLFRPVIALLPERLVTPLTVVLFLLTGLVPLLLAGFGLRTAVRGWTDRRWAGAVPGVLHMVNAGLLVHFIFSALMSV